MTVNSFQGEYRFLSNFWPVEVELDGKIYPSVEHAYQAAKTLDLNIREKIRQTPTPGSVKRFSRTFQVRSDWEEVKLGVMRKLLEQKFSHNPLRSQLLKTRNQPLIEGNTWNDTFWGVCRGVGLNHLGNLLMGIRDEIFFQEALKEVSSVLRSILLQKSHDVITMGGFIRDIDSEPFFEAYSEKLGNLGDFSTFQITGWEIIHLFRQRFEIDAEFAFNLWKKVTQACRERVSSNENFFLPNLYLDLFGKDVRVTLNLEEDSSLE